MTVIRNLCNLNIIDDRNFTPFRCMQYLFKPVSNRQIPERHIYDDKYYYSHYRLHSINAKVLYSGRQMNSVIFQNSIVHNGVNRQIKFIEDVLILMSILIGRNVLLSSQRYFKTFPLSPIKHISKCVCSNSTELKESLNIAVNCILDEAWQEKHDNGFHLIMLNNYADINSIESRFLSNIKIWEYLYAKETEAKHATFIEHYDHLRSTKLESKLCYLIREHILGMRNLRKEKLEIFVVLRNQLTHYGKLPIIIPDSSDWIKSLGWEGCEKYINFFQRLTHVLVLKTINIEALRRYEIFNLEEQLNNIVEDGKIP